jgi:small subunit ribosomal protein S19
MRSKWKGPFVNIGLLNRVRKHVISGVNQRRPFKVMSRDSTIVPEMMGLRFNIHCGKKWQEFEVRDLHLGHKFGEFAWTRVNPISVYEHQMRADMAKAANKGAKKK